MNKKERFLTAIRNEVPDMVPVAPLIHNRFAYKLLGRKGWKAVFEVHKMVGSIWFRGPLSIKFDVKWPSGWGEKFQLIEGEEGKIYEETKKLLNKEFPKYFAYKEDIPRMVFLTYFWSEFYTLAKYGIEELNLSPDRLFKEEDARLALKHAELCIDIADSLLMWKKQEVKS